MALVIAACSDPNALANATLSNVEDTLTLYSLATGPLTEPSAYSISTARAVRTWEVGIDFDFAFSVDNSGRPVLLTVSVLGLAPSGSVKPGLLRTSTAFDSMTRAPLNGYLTTDTIAIADRDRFYLRTGVTTCSVLGVPLYGKLEVIHYDPANASVQIRAVANQNCGYRSLQLGTPKR
jgi:hypothetical protein